MFKNLNEFLSVISLFVMVIIAIRFSVSAMIVKHHDPKKTVWTMFLDYDNNEDD